MYNLPCVLMYASVLRTILYARVILELGHQDFDFFNVATHYGIISRYISNLRRILRYEIYFIITIYRWYMKHKILKNN